MPSRFDQFRQGLYNIREALETRGGEGTVMVHDIIGRLNAAVPESQHFAEDEVRQALRVMSQQNTVWYQEEQETVLFI